MGIKSSAARIVCAVGGAITAIVIMIRGIPFVAQPEEWSIGILVGNSPTDFHGPLPAAPVLTRRDVTDVPASLVADPFLVRDGDRWYMFFEVWNTDSKQGDIGVATSPNGLEWKYERIVLDEPFHLSYPSVFQWNGQYYMVPDTYGANRVSLYRAREFPWSWEFVQSIQDGLHLDPTLVRFDDRWWLFTTPTELNDFTRLYFSDELTGPYVEHPNSPVVQFDANIARSGGNIVVHEGRVYRYIQDDDPRYGNQMYAFEVTKLTPDEFEQQMVGEGPLLRPTSRGWAGTGIHTLNPVQAADGRWIACFDGRGRHYRFGLRY